MGKYLKLAEKVVMQDTSISKEHCDIRDKSDKSILGLDSSGTPVAAKIYSKVLQDTVWLALDPSFIGDGEEIPAYTITELRMMQGATPEEIRQVHMIKKEIGGVLVEVKERRDNHDL